MHPIMGVGVLVRIPAGNGPDTGDWEQRLECSSLLRFFRTPTTVRGVTKLWSRVFWCRTFCQRCSGYFSQYKKVYKP